MPTLLHHPNLPFPPSELDRYLTNGWRPTGQSVYSSDYLRTETDAVYGCLQLRLPLADYVPKKRHRKLLRKNDQLFRVEIQRAGLPDIEQLQVNEAYLKVNPEKSTENLSFHVVGDQFMKVLDTWETRVYVKNKLIGFSYFDAGERCLYAKAGIYDPDFGDYSLGTYTMLLELDWAKANGYAYYHPGYFAPAYPIFNYKLAYGPTEYRDPATGNWQLLTGEPVNHPADPYRKCEKALELLIADFARTGHKARLLEYPSFTARYFYANSDRDQNSLLDGALLVQPVGAAFPEEIVITYDLENKTYVCYETSWSGMQDFKLLPKSPANGRARLDRPLGIFRRIASSPVPGDILSAINSLSRA